MHSTRTFLLLIPIIAAIASPAFAQTPPTTTIAEPTKLIVASPFAEPQAATRKGAIHGWQAAIGEWTIKDGALHGDELAEDHHASSCTYKIAATDLVITAQFKLGKADHIAFGCRDAIPPHHHLARTFVSRDGVWIQKMSGIAKTTKAEKLAEVKKAMDTEAWHDITIECIGNHYRAQIGTVRVEGQNERFKDAKALAALIVKGQGAQFRNVTIWEAKPKTTR